MVKDDGVPLVEDLTDLVKSARFQIGTISHGGGDLRSLLAGPADLAERTGRFLSRPGPAALVASGILALACVANFLRGAKYLRRRRGTDRRRVAVLAPLFGGKSRRRRRKAL